MVTKARLQFQHQAGGWCGSGAPVLLPSFVDFWNSVTPQGDPCPREHPIDETRRHNAAVSLCLLDTRAPPPSPHWPEAGAGAGPNLLKVLRGGSAAHERTGPPESEGAFT